MVVNMCKGAEIVELIRVVTTEGSGKTIEDPIKEVIQFWSKDGKLLFKVDKNNLDFK